MTISALNLNIIFLTLCTLAAVFSVPSTNTVAEVDTPIETCVTLNSGSASLATELIVSLSTADGTGEKKHILFNYMYSFFTQLQVETISLCLRERK